jgi:hypothetical protein
MRGCGIHRVKSGERRAQRTCARSHSILTPAAPAFARALFKRYFVLSTPVTENPLFARAMLHLPGPQQRSRTVFPLGLVSLNTFGICLFASAIRSLVNIKAYSSRQNDSSSNHSVFLLRVLIWLNCCMHYEDRCEPPNRQRRESVSRNLRADDLETGSDPRLVPVEMFSIAQHPSALLLPPGGPEKKSLSRRKHTAVGVGHSTQIAPLPTFFGRPR